MLRKNTYISVNMEKFSDMLNSIEEIKDKITDNEYKNLIESLGKIHNKNVSDYDTYEIELDFFELQQVPFLHNETDCDTFDCDEMCEFKDEVYCIKNILKTETMEVDIKKDTRLYEVINLNLSKSINSKCFFNDIAGMLINSEVDNIHMIHVIYDSMPEKLVVIVNKQLVELVTFKTFNSIRFKKID